jgi:hypothetical protein
MIQPPEQVRHPNRTPLRASPPFPLQFVHERLQQIALLLR